MIYVHRNNVTKPESLDEKKTRGQYKGKTEREINILKYEADPATFKGSYSAYSTEPVKKALETLFHGKCSYCESRYAGIQPMDVEHWRPKGEVIKKNGEKIKGYYWLASEWTNLLPSCIDCNRERYHIDAQTNKRIKLGKKNHFPVENEAYICEQISGHTRDPDNNGGIEIAQLINPCNEEPGNFIHFKEAMVFPVLNNQGNPLKKGIYSIKVYGLNRTNLVFERLEVQRLMQQRMHSIKTLIQILDESTPHIPDATTGLIEDLIEHELNSLMEFSQPEKAFSKMAQELINDFRESLGITID